MLIQSAGVPFPGEVFLLAAAAWAASRHLPIALVVLVGYVAATAGSDLGYMLGRRGGRPFVERFGSAFHIRPGQLALAELVFARHGGLIGAIMGAIGIGGVVFIAVVVSVLVVAQERATRRR